MFNFFFLYMYVFNYVKALIMIAKFTKQHIVYNKDILRTYAIRIFFRKLQSSPTGFNNHFYFSGRT